MPQVGCLRLPLKVRDVDADAWHRQDEPSKCTHQAHKELREVLVRGFLIWNQGFRVHWDLLHLRDVMMLMRPDLEGRWILLMHHAHAFEGPSLDLQGRELFLESGYELLAVLSFACSLEVIDVSAQNEHQSLGRHGFGKS